MYKSKIAFILTFSNLVPTLFLLNAAGTPKIYNRNNILTAGNYNGGGSSSDITLITQIEANGEILIDEGHKVKYSVLIVRMLSSIAG